MPDLFDFLPPVSHRHDPATSREAADRHTRSGNRSRCCAVVLALVKAHPGSTGCELWEAADADARAVLKEMQRVRQRLVDLEGAGLVRKGDARRCGVRGTTQTTWYTTDKGV